MYSSEAALSPSEVLRKRVACALPVVSYSPSTASCFVEYFRALEKLHTVERGEGLPLTLSFRERELQREREQVLASFFLASRQTLSPKNDCRKTKEAWHRAYSLHSRLVEIETHLQEYVGGSDVAELRKLWAQNHQIHRELLGASERALKRCWGMRVFEPYKYRKLWKAIQDEKAQI